MSNIIIGGPGSQPNPYGKIVKCEKCGKNKHYYAPCFHCSTFEELLNFFAPKKTDEFGVQKRFPFNGYYDEQTKNWKEKCSLCDAELNLQKDCSVIGNVDDDNKRIVVNCQNCKMRVEFNSDWELKAKKKEIECKIKKLQDELMELELGKNK